MEHAKNESELALDLAILRWGEGQDGRPKCPRCLDRTMWRRADRPRVFGCSGCGSERSVTAGTILHATKLSLVAVEAYLEAHRSALPSSARALGRRFGHCPSTAWAICMRIKSGIASLPGILFGRPVYSVVKTTLRRWSRPGPKLHPLAESMLRNFGGRSVDLYAITDAFGHTNLTIPPATAHWSVYPWRFPTDANKALAERASTLLHDVHRTVSATWLTRYLGFASRELPVQPWRVLLRAGPGSLARIRPGGAPWWVLDSDVLMVSRNDDDDTVALSMAVLTGRAVDPHTVATLEAYTVERGLWEPNRDTWPLLHGSYG